jgi:hypothetical protein
LSDGPSEFSLISFRPAGGSLHLCTCRFSASAAELRGVQSALTGQILGYRSSR